MNSTMSGSSVRIFSWVAFAASTATGAPVIQEELAELSSKRGFAGSYDSFGSEVSCLGDVDGDGVCDALVAAIDEDNDVYPWSDHYYGAVYVISGASGSVIRKHLGPEQGGRLGIRLAAGSDFDGDGVPDYAAGTLDVPRPTSEGTAYVFSGATGNVLYTLAGENPYDGFGGSLQIVGDVDGDGVDDLGLGAGGYDVDSRTTMAGRAYVYSGATGSLIYSITGTKSNQLFGLIGGIGDLDGDGRPDLCIGSNGFNAGPNGEGKVEVYSGATATLLYRRVGENPGDFFGSRSCALGDVNGDGSPEFAVWAPGHDVFDSEGRVYVYSGRKGKLLYTFDGTYKDQQFGLLPWTGDIDFNADGFSDLLIGSVYVPSYGTTASSVFVYSGRTGRMLHEIRGRNFGGAALTEGLGSSLSAGGDLNQDGIDDVIVGAPIYGADYPAEGRAYVFGGNDLFLQGNLEEYLAGDAITLSIRGGEAGALGMIALVDVNGTRTFAPILIGTLDGHGELGIGDTVPPGLSGLTLGFMGFALKGGGSAVADSIRETLVFK